MKKLLLLSFLLLFCFLCGCNSESKVSPITKNIAFRVETVFENTEYILNASTNKAGDLSLSVAVPESIGSLKLLFKEDTLRINYLELEKEIPLEAIEEDSLYKILYEGFLKAENTDNLSLSDDKYFTEFKIGPKAYKMFFGESGLPLGIKGQGTEIVFNGTTILN